MQLFELLFSQFIIRFNNSAILVLPRPDWTDDDIIAIGVFVVDVFIFVFVFVFVVDIISAAIVIVVVVDDVVI